MHEVFINCKIALVIIICVKRNTNYWCFTATSGHLSWRLLCIDILELCNIGRGIYNFSTESVLPIFTTLRVRVQAIDVFKL